MQKHVFVARQPIVNADGSIYAYELLFRGCEKFDFTPVGHSCFDETFATANVVSTVLNQFGLELVVGDAPAFINIDHNFIFHELIEAIPPTHFVFEILENIQITPQVIKRIEELSLKGYRFALDDIELGTAFFDQYKPLFDYIDIFKVDFILSSREAMQTWVPELKKLEGKVLAEKVETQEEVDFCKTLGIDYFQGYHFAKPTTLKHTSMNPEAKSVLHLIALIDKESSMQEVVKAFSSEVEITVQLLRFINSAHNTFKAPIQSIQHAITLIGLKPLRQWLLMLAFSQSIGDSSASNNPLFVLAKTRCKLMENIVQHCQNQHAMADEAAFIGLVSLLDALFEMPIETILVELNLSEMISEAILHKKGLLGQALQLAIAIEHFDQTTINTLTNELQLDFSTLESALLNSYHFSLS